MLELISVSLVFILSYTVILQPKSLPSIEELVEISDEANGEEITEFLVSLSDGTYLYFCDMLERDVLSEEEIKKPEYANIPIYEGGE